MKRHWQFNESACALGDVYMARKAFLEDTSNFDSCVLWVRCGILAVSALLSLAILSGCNATSVYLDKFDSSSPGSSPAQPQVGTSTVSGNVVVAADPTNTNASDHWLQLTRTAPNATASYVVR